MRHLVMLCCLAAAGSVGCSVDDGTAVGAVSETTPHARRASTLLASIGVEVGGERLAGAHLAEVHLAVDGEHWGVFGFDAEPTDDWTFAADGQALMRARINEDLTLSDTGPETVGGWTTFLARPLSAGDHVVQVTRLVLRNGNGKEVEVRSTAWMPFRVELGDGSAWIGDLVFTLDALP